MKQRSVSKVGFNPSSEDRIKERLANKKLVLNFMEFDIINDL